MKKKLFFIPLFALCACVLMAEVIQPTTEKIEIKEREGAYLLFTKVYETENWAEFYCIYVENKKTYKVEEAERIMYEFFSTYKRENKYSMVEVEDLKATSVGKANSTLKKRVIFRQVNKR